MQPNSYEQLTWTLATLIWRGLPYAGCVSCIQPTPGKVGNQTGHTPSQFQLLMHGAPLRLQASASQEPFYWQCPRLSGSSYTLNFHETILREVPPTRLRHPDEL